MLLLCCITMSGPAQPKIPDAPQKNHLKNQVTKTGFWAENYFSTSSFSCGILYCPPSVWRYCRGRLQLHWVLNMTATQLQTIALPPIATSHSLQPAVTISIISHGQMHLVLPLLQDLDAIHPVTPLHVVLTLNLPEALPFGPEDFAFSLQVLHNAQPLGFGANHNQAFQHAQGGFFCVLNPDIRITKNPFPALLEACSDASIGLAAPAIHNSSDGLEDSARKFPTPWRITHRVLTRRRTRDYGAPAPTLHPDWLAGMFLLMRSAVYRQTGGFDERYFLYYEDVDLCARIRLAGLDIVQLALPGVVHNAQRASHRDPKYLRWHVGSMLRFFASGAFLRWQWLRLMRRVPQRGSP